MVEKNVTSSKVSINNISVNDIFNTLPHRNTAIYYNREKILSLLISNTKGKKRIKGTVKNDTK